MRPPSAAQSRAGAVAPAPRGFPVVACPDSIARDTRCLLLTHTSITTRVQLCENCVIGRDRSLSAETTYRVARNDLNSFRLLPMVFDRTRVVKELEILVSAVQSRPCPPF